MKEMQIDIHFHLRLILMLQDPVIVFFFVAFFDAESFLPKSILINNF